MIRHDTNSSRIFMQNQPTSDVRPSKTKFLVLSQPIVPKSARRRKRPRRWRRRPRRIPGYHGGQSENGMGYGPGYEPTHLNWVMGEVMGQEDCNRTSFCDGSARSARVKQNAAEQLENTVGRSDALVFLDSLDSLPE